MPPAPQEVWRPYLKYSLVSRDSEERATFKKAPMLFKWEKGPTLTAPGGGANWWKHPKMCTPVGTGYLPTHARALRAQSKNTPPVKNKPVSISFSCQGGSRITSTSPSGASCVVSCPGRKMKKCGFICSHSEGFRDRDLKLGGSLGEVDPHPDPDFQDPRSIRYFFISVFTSVATPILPLFPGQRTHPPHSTCPA